METGNREARHLVVGGTEAENGSMEGWDPRSKGTGAVALVAFTLVLIAASVVLDLASGNGLDVAGFLFLGGIAVTYAAVGLVIALRRPGNVLAWVFLGAAVSAGLGGIASSYADHWLATDSGPALLGRSAAAYGDTSWVPFILVPLTFLLLLFPDGKVISPRWRKVAAAAGAGIALTVISGLLKAGPIEDYPSIRNPLGVDSPAIGAIAGLGALLALAGLVGSVAALIVRFRRAQGIERAQMKWLSYAGAMAALALIVGTAFYDLNEAVANAVIMSGVMTLPGATGVAITRYRLYDIDVVVNRTLVYGALTATLAGVYLGAVLLLQLALEPVTSGSGPAVAVSTLAVAALFRPARARIQGSVDRRFFRRRYDARHTLEDFSARLRDEIALGRVEADLSAVVMNTLRPTHVSIWLREGES